LRFGVLACPGATGCGYAIVITAYERLERVVLPSLHYSITPSPHKPLKFQQSKSPLGITKAWSYGPGFLLRNLRASRFIVCSIEKVHLLFIVQDYQRVTNLSKRSKEVPESKQLAPGY